MSVRPVTATPRPALAPFVSVILPVRNESRYIDGSLGTILAQDYAADRFEVIIADGRSTDDTVAKIRGYQLRHPNVRLVDNSDRLQAPGMNRCLAAARGDVIVRIDGHSEYSPDYISRCVEKLEQTGADNVGGKMTAISDGYFGECVAQATSTRFGVGGAQFHYAEKETWVDTVYLGAWRRELFERLGLFDEAVGCNEDDEFNYRLQEQGGRVLLSPTIRSVYYNRGTPRSLARQYFRYGYWKVRVMQKHPGQMRSRQFVPPIFVATLLVALLLAAFSTLGQILFLTVLGSYLLANCAASLITARKSSWRYLPGLIATFAILHVGYGLGFLTGLARFSNRWSDPRGKVAALSSSWSVPDMATAAR
jgi:succinoglycan biosynthesis protein ExoA